MAKVTYLEKKDFTYTYICGIGSYNFIGGKVKPVPDSIALRMRNMMFENGKHKGEPMFKVEGLPQLVTSSNINRVGGQLTCF